MSDAVEIIKNKIDSLKEILEWRCIKNDAEDYQFEEFYKIEVLEEVLKEIENDWWRNIKIRKNIFQR